MPRAYRCRKCKGKPYLPKKPEGACPYCLGFYRYEPAHVLEGEVDGAELQPIKDGEIISQADLMAGKEEPDEKKRPTGLSGVDHVFDGGLPRVGTILICSPAGSGKTTWLWGLLHKIAEEQKQKALFLSTEQATRGLRRQFKRLPLPPSRHMVVCSESDHEAILRIVEKGEPDLFVLDSLHDVEGVTDENAYDLASGGASAVKRVAKEIGHLAEEMGFLAFLVGHMTNEEALAGGSHLRHEVDAVLVLRYFTDDTDPRRILEFRGKSRFGEVGRQALLQMEEGGMRDLGPLLKNRKPPPPVPTGSGPRDVN